MPSAADDRLLAGLLSGPTAVLRGLERQGLVVQVVDPPFDLGPPAWRLTAEGLARSLALLEGTARRVVAPVAQDETTDSVFSCAG